MRRIALRPPGALDADSIEVWLAEAVGAVYGLARAGVATTSLPAFLNALGPGQHALVIQRAAEPIGIVVEHRDRSGPVRVEFLAVAAPLRNLGLGAEAVLELERLHAGRPIVAGVPVSNGLAIYFWLRIGYAPIYPRPAAVSRARDRIWMGRSEVIV